MSLNTDHFKERLPNRRGLMFLVPLGILLAELRKEHIDPLSDIKDITARRNSCPTTREEP